MSYKVDSSKKYNVIVVRRLGRRGTAVLLVGILWILIGTLVYVDKRPINPGDAILYESIPLIYRAALWYTTGLLAILTISKPRWVGIGFGLLSIMPAERLLSFCNSLIQYVIPGPPLGTLRSFIGGGIWIVALLFLVLIAGWDDDVRHCEVDD